MKSLINCHNIVKKYGTTTVLDNFSYQFKNHTITAVCGENGSGKTTLLAILAGVRRSDRGSVKWQNKDIHSKLNTYHRMLGYLSDPIGLYPDLSVYENLLFTARMKGCNNPRYEIEQQLKCCMLTDVKNQLTKTLSHGYRQRTALARSLINQPCVLLLDEPDSGLDREQKETLKKILITLKTRTTIVIASHDKDLINAVTDEAITLDKHAPSLHPFADTNQHA